MAKQPPKKLKPPTVASSSTKVVTKQRVPADEQKTNYKFDMVDQILGKNPPYITSGRKMVASAHRNHLGRTSRVLNLMLNGPRKSVPPPPRNSKKKK